MPVRVSRGDSAGLTKQGLRPHPPSFEGSIAFAAVLALASAVAVAACGQADDHDGVSPETNSPVPSTPPANASFSGDVVTTLAVPVGERMSDHFTVTDLAKSTSPVKEYSPDGASFFSITGSGLTITYDGTQRNVQPKVVSAVWAPDSQSLAVVVYDTPITSSRQELPVYMISADGSEKREIAKTTVTGAVQFLRDGTLAYQFEGELHLLDTATRNDRVAATGLETDLTDDSPYLVSPDVAAVALMHGETLSVLNFASGSVNELTTTVDLRRWGSYAWWSNDVLIYSDTGPKGLEAAPGFSPSTGRRKPKRNSCPETEGGHTPTLHPRPQEDGSCMFTGTRARLWSPGHSTRP